MLLNQENKKLKIKINLNSNLKMKRYILKENLFMNFVMIF